MQSVFVDKNINNNTTTTGICNVIENTPEEETVVAPREQHTLGKDNALENYYEDSRQQQQRGSQKKKLESHHKRSLSLVTQSECSEVNANQQPSHQQHLPSQLHCKQMRDSFKDHIYENLTFIENSLNSTVPRIGHHSLSPTKSLAEEEDNIYENICEKCDQIFSGELCKNCASHKITFSSGSTERKKRNFSDFFNSLKRRRKTEKKPPQPPKKIEIIHNVDGFGEDPFKANQTFDLQEICALKLQHLKLGRRLNDPLPSVARSDQEDEVIWRRKYTSDDHHPLPAAADDERDDSWFVDGDRDLRLNSLTNIYENLFESLAITSRTINTSPLGEVNNKPDEESIIITAGAPLLPPANQGKASESPELVITEADVPSDDTTAAARRRSEHNNSPELQTPVIIISPSVATWMTSLEAETYDDVLDEATTRAPICGSATLLVSSVSSGFFVKHIPSRTFDDRFYNNYYSTLSQQQQQQRSKAAADNCKTTLSGTENCGNNRSLSCECELDLNGRVDCFKSEVTKNLEHQRKVSRDGQWTRTSNNNTCPIVITVKDDIRYLDDDRAADLEEAVSAVIDNNANYSDDIAKASVTHTNICIRKTRAVKSPDNYCAEERDHNPKNCNNSSGVLHINDNKCIPEGTTPLGPFRGSLLSAAAATAGRVDCRRICRRRNAITECRNALTFQILTRRLLSNTVRGIVLVIDPLVALKGVLKENKSVLQQKRHRSRLRAFRDHFRQQQRRRGGDLSSFIVLLVMGVLSLVNDDISVISSQAAVPDKPNNGENELDGHGDGGTSSINSPKTDSIPLNIIRHKDVAEMEAYRGSREAIYQPIWKFHTVGIGRESSSSDTFDGSYNTNDFAEIGDAVEWEIAEEFEFGSSRETLLLEEKEQALVDGKGAKPNNIKVIEDSKEMPSYEDLTPPWRLDYRSVCILYDPTGNTANNTIIYYDGEHQQQRHNSDPHPHHLLREEVLTNACESEKLLLAERNIFPQHPRVPQNNSYAAAMDCEAGSSIMTTKGDEEAQVMVAGQVGGVSKREVMPFKVYLIPDSVTAWKFMLLDVHYAEDEEDVIMSVPNLLSIPYDAPVLLETKKLPSLQGPTKEANKIQKTNLLNPRKYVMSGRLNIEDQKTSYLTKSTVGSYKQIEFGSVDNLNFLSKSKSTSSIISSSPTKKSPRFLRFRPSSPREQDKQRTVIFGSDLSTLKLDADAGVPKFVVECIRLIEEPENIQTNGVYRASGNKNSIELVRKRMNDRLNLRKDTIWQFLEKQDVHTLTGSLKLFFRSLSKPLIKDSLFDQLPVELGDEKSLGHIRAMIDAIEDVPKATLKYLFKHLTVVTENQIENLMNSSNLSICWGACLFASSATAFESFESGNIIRKNHFVKLLIDHYHQIFEN